MQYACRAKASSLLFQVTVYSVHHYTKMYCYAKCLTTSKQ